MRLKLELYYLLSFMSRAVCVHLVRQKHMSKDNNKSYDLI